MTRQLLEGVLFSFLISTFSYALRFLTGGGATAQFVLGVIILGLGGWQWIVPILTFFILSSLLSFISKRTRPSVEFAKSSRRDWAQVCANGGTAAGIVLLWFFTRWGCWFVAYLGAVAAATADTWGTEVGIHSHSSPRLVTNLQPIETGTSGAISLLGFLAGTSGALAIGLSAAHWLSSPQTTNVMIATIFGGCSGSLIDSLLGATIQTQYSCSVCGKTSERMEHCGMKTTQKSGIRWINNDVVNFACTMAGAASSMGVAWILG
jgi:uncharacterized protein (TIGR00297 family)